MRIIATLVFIFSFLHSVLGQEIFHQSYNVKQGAPCNEYFGVREDNNGYLWFVSDDGVTSYNGIKFTNHDLSKSELENCIIDIYRERDGTIWFISINGLLAHTQGDSIVPYERNDELKKVLINKSILSSFNISSSGNIYYGIRNHGIITITKDSISLSQSNESFITNGDEYAKKHIDTFEGELCYHYGKSKLARDRIKNGGRSKLPGFIFINGEKFDLPINSMGGSFFNQIKISDNHWICSNQKVLFELCDGKFTLIDTFKYEILDLLMIDNWIYVACNHGGGVIKYDYESKKKKTFYLKGLSISGICSNFANEIWCTSLEDGIYRCTNPKINSLLPINYVPDNITGMVNKNDTTFVLYSEGSIKAIHQNKIIDYSQVNSDLKMLWIDSINGQLLVGNHTFIGEAYLIKDSEVTPLYSNRQNDRLNMFSRINSNNHYYYFHPGRNGYFKIPISFYTEFCDKVPDEVLHIYKETENMVLFTGGNMIYSYDKNQMNFQRVSQHPNLISDLNILPNGKIVLGNKYHGLEIWNDSDTIRINSLNGLINDKIIQIEIEKDTIWCLNHNGINKITLDNYSPFTYHIDYLSPENGFISNDSKKFILTKNQILIHDNYQVYDINRSTFPQVKQELRLLLTHFSHKNYFSPTGSSYQIPYNQRKISLKYDCIDFSLNSNIKYYYRYHSNNEWTETENNELLLEYLPNGKYQLEIYAKSGSRISNTISIELTIMKPWWKELWFVICVIITITLMMILVVVSIIKSVTSKQRKKYLQEQEKSKLKLKALKAQMNPHFMFNSLNSIQYYILENDSKSAAKYLSKFSKLIRLILEESDVELGLMSNELDMILLYLELEQVRMENKFDFEINVSENINQHQLLIPSLLIQPIIENSVWHGMTNKKEKGKIEVDFKLDNNLLICSVTDNGIGRKKAKEFKRSGQFKKSMGMSISRERLNILHSKVQRGVHIETIDLEENEVSKGTKVILRIPIKKLNN